MMPCVDLNRLTKGKVGMLTGHVRGEQARGMFNLDSIGERDEMWTFTAPSNLDTITPSFVQGLLGASLHRLGAERLRALLDLTRLPAILQEDFELGLQRLELHYAREKKLPH